MRPSTATPAKPGLARRTAARSCSTRAAGAHRSRPQHTVPRVVDPAWRRGTFGYLQVTAPRPAGHRPCAGISVPVWTGARGGLSGRGRSQCLRSRKSSRSATSRFRIYEKQHSRFSADAPTRCGSDRAADRCSAASTGYFGYSSSRSGIGMPAAPKACSIAGNGDGPGCGALAPSAPWPSSRRVSVARYLEQLHERGCRVVAGWRSVLQRGHRILLGALAL